MWSVGEGECSSTILSSQSCICVNRSVLEESASNMCDVWKQIQVARRSGPGGFDGRDSPQHNESLEKACNREILKFIW